MALFRFETKFMAEQKTQIVVDEDEPMQRDPIYLSSDEDSETK